MTELFSIDPAPVFSAPAAITGPGGERRALLVVWRHKTRTALAAWLASRETRAETLEAEADMLLEVMDGWDNADAPFDRAALIDLLNNYHRASHELLLAYVDGLHGARLGN